jgi:hypothetical protein
MATAIHDTTQSVSLDSPEGKKLLRKIVKERHDWRFSANATDGWRLTFTREVKGRTGEPNATIVVETDSVIPLLTGWSEEREGLPPAPRWVNGRMASTVATLLLAGCSLAVRTSSGSQRSREHGISYSSLVARFPDAWDEVAIDTTTYVNGLIVSYGAVS